MRPAYEVANQIKNLGLPTRVMTSNGVMVNLNRGASVTEVQAALNQVSVNADFKCVSTNDGILVTW